MRSSEFFVPVRREDPADAEFISHKLLIRAGLIRMLARGVYSFLPMGWRVIRRIEAIIREEMEACACHEVRLPAVQPADLWQESGRWGQYGPELLRFEDRRGARFCLGPTHEEVITALVRADVGSHKQLPLRLFQIQTKFRDELRPRAGLLRGREFIMKDAYSFDIDEEASGRAYEAMRAAYGRTFARMGFDFRAVEADTGAMGGSRSHEFQALTASGEDLILGCGACGYGANVELHEVRGEEAARACPVCEGRLEASRGIEVGHIFHLGTRYSAAMGAHVLDERGRSTPVLMGCYGMGVSRIMAAVVEQHHDEDGIVWPMGLAPFEVLVLPLGRQGGPAQVVAGSIYEGLRARGVSVLLDDRDERSAVKFKDADLVGVPLRVTVGGRGLERGVVELKRRGEGGPVELSPEAVCDRAVAWIGQG